jgi:tetratricopeptide (TPR) repeat protein
VRNEVLELTKPEFERLCRDILAGLGMAKPTAFSAPGVEQSYRVEIVRESSDKMFRTVETWLCVFQTSRESVDLEHVESIAQAAIAANVRQVFLVVFGSMAPSAGDRLRETLAAEEIGLACLTDSLAQCLASDLGNQTSEHGFSFTRLRKHARTKFAESLWHDYFQTVSIQPARILPLQKEQDAALSEADLVRAIQGGSLLLLGEPGAGKTTSLVALAKDLASAGPLTPVFVPLGRYDGDFWETLGEALAPGAACVPKPVARELVESGVLVLLLDGINEVQDPDLHRGLVSELNEFTAPDEPTLHSHWIVSGRIHDYQQTHHQLVHLERRRWEMQPFTGDLIYQLLANVLDGAQALTLYQEMGESVRELCSNPLLLNMVVAVHRQHGKPPVGRGALYRQFVDLLLGLGADRQLLEQKRAELQRFWPETLTDQIHRRIAEQALAALASGASTTQIPWRDACNHFAGALSEALDSSRAAVVLLDEMLHRGILHSDVANRVSFFHHTFQEYFHALQLVGRPAEELIPRGGVAAQDREAVIFVAGLMDDPTRLVRRALAVDTLLTFEIVRDCPMAVPKDLIHELARQVWQRTQPGGTFYGANRRWALLFKRLAVLLGKKLEDLVRTAAGSSDESALADALMMFYAQLGDAQGQQKALAAVVSGEDVPEPLLWAAAWAAHTSANYQRALDLWTRYLEKHPADAIALNNRAIAYGRIGRTEAALADYEQAVKEDPPAYVLTNYADLLNKLGRKQEALEQLRLAIQQEPAYGLAYNILANILEADEPEEALRHREQAVRYAPHEEDLRIYLRKLADLQEKLGRHADAIRSLRDMIALDPTSPYVKSWKERIAGHRQALDAEERKRSARERLLEHGELPLPTLVIEWLKAAGGQVEQATSASVLAKGFAGMAGSLPVSLLPEPRITGAGLRAALENARAMARQAKRILVVAAADALELEARYTWAAMQDEFSLGLVSALEIRDALLQNDMECRGLLDRVMNRSGLQNDPFEYKGIVREPTEFFGRQTEIGDLIGRISRGQQVGLYGIHKIGKSSLLEQLRRSLHVSRPEFTVMQIELDGQGKGPGDFYRRVLERLPGLRELPPAQSISSAVFRRMLRDYHDSRTKERPSHRILLIVDEYPFLLPDSRGAGGLPGFIEVLGVLKTMHQEGWFSLLPCGRSAALNRQGRWAEGENPFIDLLHPCFLGPLPREEMDSLMTTLGRRGQLKFEPEALSEVFSETAGHPSLSRALGSQILREGKGAVGVARVRSAVEAFLKDRDQTAILRAIYETRMDADEQEMARTLAMRGPQPRTALFPQDADAGRRRQIRDALQNLLDTTVLEQADERIAHRYGLLRRVVQLEAKELGFD